MSSVSWLRRQFCFRGAVAGLAEGPIIRDLPNVGVAVLVEGGLVGAAIVGVTLTTRLLENVLAQSTKEQVIDPRRAAHDVLTSLCEAAPVVGLIILIVGEFLETNVRLDRTELKIDASNSRMDALNIKIDTSDVRLGSEMPSLAEETAAILALNEQIFHLAQLRAQEEAGTPCSSTSAP